LKTVLALDAFLFLSWDMLRKKGKDDCQMGDARIQILNQGPIIVAGHVALVDDEGYTIEHQEPVALCRCGKSENMPYCDGISKGNMKTCSRAQGIL
jgi:hypothetical protein